MIEKWKDIDELHGNYQVSNVGRVRRSKPHTGKGVSVVGRIISTEINPKGYEKLTISRRGERLRFYIHRLVATYYLPNPNNHTHVHHINHIKTDNRVSNLMWCSLNENNLHNLVITVDSLIHLLDSERTYTKQDIIDIVSRYR